ncbi:hypothetical protein ABIC84_000714 [Mucilaginibacter sp. 3215]
MPATGSGGAITSAGMPKAAAMISWAYTSKRES